MHFQLAASMGGRSQGKRRFLAIVPLDHQVLPSVIARRLASRGAQAHTPDIAAQLHALTQLASHAAHRQFAQRQHAIPEHRAIFQRLGDAGV
ncbi:hypothetical protein D3C81_1796050 [compost metagenome]